MNSWFLKTDDMIRTVFLYNWQRYLVAEVTLLHTARRTLRVELPCMKIAILGCENTLQDSASDCWHVSTKLSHARHPCQPVATETYSVTMQLSSQFIQKAALVYAHNRNSIVLKTTMEYINLIFWDFGIAGILCVLKPFHHSFLSVHRLMCYLWYCRARKSLAGFTTEVPCQQEALPAFAIASVLPSILRNLLGHICFMGP
jgi:hypothetical protein